VSFTEQSSPVLPAEHKQVPLVPLHSPCPLQNAVLKPTRGARGARGAISFFNVFNGNEGTSGEVVGLSTGPGQLVCWQYGPQ